MTSSLKTPGADAGAQNAGRQEWSKPEISSFEAVAVTKAVWFRIGDGINNLS